MFGRMGQPQSAPSAGRRRLTYKAGLKTHFAQLPPDQKCDLCHTCRDVGGRLAAGPAPSIRAGEPGSEPAGTERSGSREAQPRRPR